MRVIREANGNLTVIDARNRRVTLHAPLWKLSDIFNNEWAYNDANDIVTDIKYIYTDEARSFKALKHYVAGYILVNELTEKVPERYVKAHFRNTGFQGEDNE